MVTVADALAGARDIAAETISDHPEVRRLTRENCDELVYIPMHGLVESLNVSVATGIALFEAVRQRTTGPSR